MTSLKQSPRVTEYEASPEPTSRRSVIVGGIAFLVALAALVFAIAVSGGRGDTLNEPVQPETLPGLWFRPSDFDKPAGAVTSAVTAEPVQPETLPGLWFRPSDFDKPAGAVTSAVTAEPVQPETLPGLWFRPSDYDQLVQLEILPGLWFRPSDYDEAVQPEILPGIWFRK